MGGAPLNWLVAGLGNPGPRYAATRHNIGFLALERMARELGARLRDAHRGSYGEASTRGGPVGLLMPQTFMNLSGESVGPAMQAGRVRAERLLVIHDEIDLPAGELRYKLGGGLAGHNGLKSIAQALGTQDFHRVRIGVGRPPAGDPRPIKAWVLSPFEPDVDVDRMAAEAAAMALDLVEAGVVDPPRRLAFEPLP